MYLLIFEDGTIRQTNIEPTESDYASVNDGVLDVLKFQAGVFLRHDGSMWSEVEHATIDEGNAWHTP